MTFPHSRLPRKPKIKVTLATPELVKFTLTDTDVSVANALRRIILAEVPSMAIEIVNMEENETCLFDEFIAHRMGLLPLAAHAVGDIPPDEGYVEYKDCNCFDGCPYCTVEFKLDVNNAEDKVMSITHFDVEPTNKYKREDWPDENEVRLVPSRNEKLDLEPDSKENGILLAKMRKDNCLRMTCQARKGVAKYHSKWMTVATAVYNYQPRIEINREEIDSLTLDEKIDFLECCPRKVFETDIEDKIQVAHLQKCIFCDECVSKGKVYGKKNMVTVKMDPNMFHFIVEAVTPEGPRSAIDVVRASMRILDYKLQQFLTDAFSDKITEWLPRQSTAKKTDIRYED